MTTELGPDPYWNTRSGQRELIRQAVAAIVKTTTTDTAAGHSTTDTAAGHYAGPSVTDTEVGEYLATLGRHTSRYRTHDTTDNTAA